MGGVVGSLLPRKEIGMEFLAPRFSSGPASAIRDILGSEPADGSPLSLWFVALSLSASTINKL